MPLKRTPPKSPGAKQHKQKKPASPEACVSTDATDTSPLPQVSTDGNNASPLKKQNKKLTTQTAPTGCGLPKNSSDGKLTHFGSETNLSKPGNTSHNITTRNVSKRLRRDSDNGTSVSSPIGDVSIERMIAAQNTKLDAIMEFMQNVNTQMNEVQDSLEFMSHKYDELLGRFNSMEQERREEKKYIETLEKKIEYLEKNDRITDIEIKNIPPSNTENKSDLLNILKKTGAIINVNIEQHDIRNIYRVSTAVPNNKPIIVEFNNIFKKDEVLKSVRSFNGRHPSNKLSTSHLSLQGPSKPVFITESLTFKTKKLYAVARDFAKSHKYKYCWTSRGTVYLRLNDGTQAHRINSESDLDKIKP